MLEFKNNCIQHISLPNKNGKLGWKNQREDPYTFFLSMCGWKEKW
jgi:hypothetical protein